MFIDKCNYIIKLDQKTWLYLPSQIENVWAS